MSGSHQRLEILQDTSCRQETEETNNGETHTPPSPLNAQNRVGHLHPGIIVAGATP